MPFSYIFGKYSDDSYRPYIAWEVTSTDADNNQRTLTVKYGMFKEKESSYNREVTQNIYISVGGQNFSASVSWNFYDKTLGTYNDLFTKTNIVVNQPNGDATSLKVKAVQGELGYITGTITLSSIYKEPVPIPLQSKDSPPKLFEHDATSFNTNGLGVLSDFTYGVVTEELNGEFELEMDYPVNGRRYSDLKLRRIIVAKPNPYDLPQAFRIYSISKPIDGVVTVNAHHISYDLTGYPVSPFTANSASAAFSSLKSKCLVSECPFTFATTSISNSSISVTTPSSIRSVLGGDEGNILDVYGGEYTFDNFQVKHAPNRGSDNGVYIRYGKNLTDFNQEENCSDVFTGVYPYWYGSEYNSDTGETTQKLVTYGIVNVPGTFEFTRILPVDFTSEFDEPPSSNDLKTYAESYISQNNIGTPKVSLSVSFISLKDSQEYYSYAILETIKLGDTIHVEFPEMGVSASSRCIKTVYDLSTCRYESVALGDYESDLAATISGSLTAQSEQSAALTKTKIDNLVANEIVVNKLDATQASIDELQANAITTGTLEAAIAELGYINADEIEANYVKTTFLEANYLTSEEIEANYIDAEYLEAHYLTAEEIEATYVDTNELEANYITADDIDAIYVRADTVVAGDVNAGNIAALVANIQTILSGYLGTGALETIHLTANNAVIDNGIILNAMIQSLEAGKITSGTILTNLVKIASETGNLEIFDNTIKITDNNNIVRVQIGEDSNGDYNYYLWDANGNLMWSPTGVTEAGLNDGIIKDANIAEDAAISGSKIDISSVAQEINDDDSITFSANKILINDETLSAAFTEITEKVDFVETQFSSLETDVDGITSVIGSGEQTEEGTVLSRLNVLEANSDGISLLLSEMTTNLEETTSDFQDKYDTLSGDINNLSSEQESFMRQVSQALEMTPDGTSLIFTEIQAKIDSIDTDISEQISGIDWDNLPLNASAEVKELVSSYIHMGINGVEIGRSGDPIHVQLANNKLSFIRLDSSSENEGHEVAYFEDDMLYVTDAEFLNSIIIGNIVIKSRENGNLSFKLRV